MFHPKPPTHPNTLAGWLEHNKTILKICRVARLLAVSRRRGPSSRRIEAALGHAGEDALEILNIGGLFIKQPPDEIGMLEWSSSSGERARCCKGGRSKARTTPSSADTLLTAPWKGRGRRLCRDATEQRAGGIRSRRLMACAFVFLSLSSSRAMPGFGVGRQQDPIEPTHTHTYCTQSHSSVKSVFLDPSDRKTGGRQLQIIKIGHRENGPYRNRNLREG